MKEIIDSINASGYGPYVWLSLGAGIILALMVILGSRGDRVRGGSAAGTNSKIMPILAIIFFVLIVGTVVAQLLGYDAFGLVAKIFKPIVDKISEFMNRADGSYIDSSGF